MSEDRIRGLEATVTLLTQISSWQAGGDCGHVRVTKGRIICLRVDSGMLHRAPGRHTPQPQGVWMLRTHSLTRRGAASPQDALTSRRWLRPGFGCPQPFLNLALELPQVLGEAPVSPACLRGGSAPSPGSCPLHFLLSLTSLRRGGERALPKTCTTGHPR